METTIGDLAGGGQSWHHYEWAIDSTGPLVKDQLAYRISYEGTDGTTYYRNTRDDKEDIYGALTWTPTPWLTMQFFGQYYEVRDNEVNGFNRPTQALIDNGSYITGPYSPFAGGSFPGLVEPTGIRRSGRNTSARSSGFLAIMLMGSPDFPRGISSDTTAPISEAAHEYLIGRSSAV